MKDAVEIILIIWLFCIMVPCAYYSSYRLVLSAGYSRKKAFVFALFPPALLLLKRTPSLEAEMKKLIPLLIFTGGVMVSLIFLSNVL